MTKILWERLKKLYGNEPTTAEPTCDDMMRNASHESTYDEGRSTSSYNIDEGTHLFMAQESEGERHTSENDHPDHFYRRDVFGSDSEGEEEEEEKVDLEGELVNTLEELNRVRKEYKLFKNVAIVEHN